jgi:hypothetical protein
MKLANLQEGDIVSTLGYYEIGDGGESQYEIMTYDNWWKQLPDDCKLVSYGVNVFGYFPFRKLMVDNFGNHRLNNGLIAKLIINDVVKVEQWGCVGDGEFNNNQPLRHLFGQVKTGKIQFGKDKVYAIRAELYNEANERYEEIDYKEADKKNFKTNPYATIAGTWLGNRNSYTKPIIVNAHDLILDGNNCTLFIPDNSWYVGGGGQSMGIIELIHSIINVEIKNFNIDGNGLNQIYYIDENGETKNQRLSNHGIFYSGSVFYDTKKLFEAFDKYSIDKNELEPFWEKKSDFSYVNIHHNKIYRLGTGVVTGDCGGDAMLIIPPGKASTDIYFENNYVEDVGRWFFAMDLVGDYNDCINYKIRNNVNTITENNYILVNETKRYRGLGWIDFEATRRWVNLVIENNISDNLPAFAMNGRYNDEVQPCENIYFRNNIIRSSGLNYYSAYPYDIYWYGAYIKNLVFENNTIKRGNPNTSSLGVAMENARFSNNKIIDIPLVIPSNLKGEIIIDSNTRCSLNENNEIVEGAGSLFEISGTKYNPDNKLLIKYVNNNGGMTTRFGGGVCHFLSNEDNHKFDNITMIIENNNMTSMNFILNPYWNVEFNPNQLRYDLWNSYTLTYGAMSVRGAKASTSHNCSDSFPLHEWRSCGLLYNQGNIIAQTDSEYILCTKSGYIPITRELFGVNTKDIDFASYKGKEIADSLSSARYLYTDDNVYLVRNKGVLSEDVPTHTEGVALCGDVELEYLYPVATYKKRLNRESDKVAKIVIDGDEKYEKLTFSDEYVSFCLSKSTIAELYGCSFDIDFQRHSYETENDFLIFNYDTNNNKNNEGFAVNWNNTQHLQIRFKTERMANYTKNLDGLKQYLFKNNMVFYIHKA